MKTLLTTILLTAGLMIPAQALTFNFIDTGGAPVGSVAHTGYQQAGALWQSHLGDPVTVNLQVGFSPLSPGTLAQTGSNSSGWYAWDVQSALYHDQTSLLDAYTVANFPASGAQFYTNNSAGQLIWDNNQSLNNVAISVNNATARAQGLTAAISSTVDGSITFNSNVLFDFNRSDGIAANAIDFVGVAAHEIGHALGFTSGVDVVDYNTGDGPNGPYGVNLDNYCYFTTMDMLRYSYGWMDLSTNLSPYFSVDGGATNMGWFSTGVYNGDGRQASHWHDNMGLGIMDPTAGPGEMLSISVYDLQLMDAIGWDLIQAPIAPVPEPTGMFVLLGLTLLGGARRRSTN